MKSRISYQPIDTNNAGRVLDEARTTTSMAVEGLDFGPVENVFADIRRLFLGRFPGFRECNTKYHDFRHTMDTFLALARLIHGARVNGRTIEARHAILGLISALMHDTGFIQRIDDIQGTGAKYTLVHISRSIEFMDEYFSAQGFSKKEFLACRNMLLCTGLNIDISKLHFSSAQNKLMSKMLGTADLLGQMADRNYLEKLPFLFLEFIEGGVPGFDTELDFMKNTLHFHELTKQRFALEMGGVNQYMRAHFRARWNLDRDLYHEAIEDHMKYLADLLERHPENYRDHLRREGMMKKLLGGEVPAGGLADSSSG